MPETPATGPVRLEDAIRTALSYLKAIQEYMKAEVYALEETEYDAPSKRFRITISLQRTDAPKKRRVIGPSSFLGTLAGLSAPSVEEVNYNYVLRCVEVDEATGLVVKMSDVGP